jgi:prolyl-tRNA synthetase
MKELGVTVGRMLDGFQKLLFERALRFREANSVHVDSWKDFEAVFADQGSKFVWAHWDGTGATEARIKELTKATIRCIPLDGEGPAPEPGKCVLSGAASARRVLFSKNY